MPLHGHWELFNKIKPQIELGIAIASFCVTNQPLRDRVLIRSPFLSMGICLILTLVHLESKFDGQLTTNLVMTLTIFVVCCQMVLKTLCMWYDRDNLLKLLDKTTSLHNDHENEEICAITEKNLLKFNNIWLICFK